ncbi:activator-dependent family glycosyltransferase [Streptomyces spiramenti]|uniref:Activator-dependent family glycosyltransferase n=1 Tax=Streptomyces spiramenti TaxID=2720606 RepID=A0ABX1AJN6_9ACTN|nr:activator-dependent family glycosyltransferase [Streptomyces spiramenti]NJP64818.1 activator-dependent family glycosyltransferase [Streptomyces spiramenti]
MRVLFTVFAAKTHMFNQVPLAWALQAAGHEVRMASQPDLAEAITRTGLTAVPVGEELGMGATAGGGPTAQTFQGVAGSMIEERPETLTWERVLGAFTVACSVQYEYLAGQAMTDDLVEFCREWQPDLVIWDALTFAGAVAARSCGAAQARMLFGMDYVARMYGFYRELRDRQPVEQREDPVSDWLAGRLARYDVPYDPSLDRELITGQWTIDPTPGWMQFELDHLRVPVRHIPYNGPTAVPGWIHERPAAPRVCLSLGMSGRELLGGDVLSVGELLCGLADFDIELVATLNRAQLAEVESLPDNVRAVDFVPLNELVPTCSAVIHHGGFGTLGSVLGHGVPSMTIPAPWWDEADLGRSLAARDAGVFLEPGNFTLDELRSGLSRLLHEPVLAEGAARVREELLKTPSPRATVSRLRELTEQYRPGR